MLYALLAKQAANSTHIYIWTCKSPDSLAISTSPKQTPKSPPVISWPVKMQIPTALIHHDYNKSHSLSDFDVGPIINRNLMNYLQTGMRFLKLLSPLLRNIKRCMKWVLVDGFSRWPEEGCTSLLCCSPPIARFAWIAAWAAIREQQVNMEAGRNIESWSAMCCFVFCCCCRTPVVCVWGWGTLKILRIFYIIKLRLAFMFVPEYYRSGNAFPWQKTNDDYRVNWLILNFIPNSIQSKYT